MFPQHICTHCGRTTETMPTDRNPMAATICFSCLSSLIDIHSIQSAALFCRTYNIAFAPDLWIKLAERPNISPALTIHQYAEMALNPTQAAYVDLPPDFKDPASLTWERLDNLWAERRKQFDILAHVDEVRESFIERARLNWGAQYSFEELLKLEDLYYQSLRANSITNPIQRESLRTLLKVMIDMNKAIATKDSGELKNLTNSFAQLAKTAQLDNLIDETHTDDLTTLAEIVQIVEDSGFQMPYYDGKNRDAIDFAIKDITECVGKLVKNATGLGSLIEQMQNKYRTEEETKAAQEAQNEAPLASLLDTYSDDTPIPDEDDALITQDHLTEDDF